MDKIFLLVEKHNFGLTATLNAFCKATSLMAMDLLMLS